MIKILLSFCFVFSFFTLQAYQDLPSDYHLATYTILDARFQWLTGEIMLNNGSKWRVSDDLSLLKKWKPGEPLVASFSLRATDFFIFHHFSIKLYNIERDETAYVFFINQEEINEFTSLVQNIDLNKSIILLNNGEQAKIKDVYQLNFWTSGDPIMILLANRPDSGYMLFNTHRFPDDSTADVEFLNYANQNPL